MRDTSPPPNRSGSNKAIVFLLLGGLVILAAAGVVLYKRRAEPPKPPPEPPVVAEKLDIPAPLVVSQPTRPSLNDKEDAGASDEEKPKGPRRKRTHKSRSVGSIDKKAVNRYMNSHFAEVKACYEHQLKKNSFLEGKLDLNIDVSVGGKVTGITINKDTVRSAPMLACVRRTIRRWKFPKPTGGHVIIAKTFNFKKKS